MAELVGDLRKESTYGEIQTGKLLRDNLPKEYTVYVETPIRKKREIRYPDFIILTNYGVVVLEVKDWVVVERADPSGAKIRTRSRETRWEKNPVNTAREYAIALSNELKARCGQDGTLEPIPWSYAAVLYNLPTSVITQLRRPWGEEFVWSQADLENPDILLNRIRQTFPAKRMRPLTKAELDQVRATIYPIVEVELDDQRVVILDEQQEKIVAEPVHPQIEPQIKKKRLSEHPHRQEQLFENLQTEKDDGKDGLPEEGKQISHNTSIRLVRGFSGSGKTLVLIQRAKFLAAQYPEWKIGVLTYNKPLRIQLEQSFKGTSIKPQTFHSLCRRWVALADEKETKLKEWLRGQTDRFPIIQSLGRTLVEKEIDWLRDMGITRRDEYLTVERRGIGRDRRLLAEERNALFEVYSAYRAYLRENNYWDWAEVPLLTLEALEKKEINEANLYDAILIDEAQDWAPVWFNVINRLVHPEHGVIFLVDDPSQSIYRFYSWKEKSVNVVGRTRWLKVPYRNTYEIYRAAYGMIADYAEIQRSLNEEGEVIKPDISSEAMRHGQSPLIRKSKNNNDELENIKNILSMLKQDGYHETQITILLRSNRNKNQICKLINGTGVNVHSMHSSKGLEMEAVIIPYLQNTFINEADETGERRLLYMAMSRARSRLYMTYSGRLPRAYEELHRQGLVDMIE